MAKANKPSQTPWEALFVQRSPARVTWQIRFNHSLIDCRQTRSEAEEYAKELAKAFRFKYAGVI